MILYEDGLTVSIPLSVVAEVLVNACEGIFDHFSLILIVARCLMFRD
jgi:hypothetical protein